jgi:type IV pilus assembly protein PilV
MLVESMIALLVLSVGLIGIAVLHGQSLAASRTAIYRSQAVLLAADMADRIRSNPTALQAYAAAPAGSRCDQPTDDGGADCSSQQMAAHDVSVWRSQLAASLPDGRGRVAVDAVAPPTYRISVVWNDPAAAVPTDIEIAFRLSNL